MAADPDIASRTVDVDEMLVRPGTYFNPQTEIVVIVDDSTSVDQEIFNMEDVRGLGLGPGLRRRAGRRGRPRTRRSRSSRPTTTAARPGSVSATALEQGDGTDDEEEESEAQEPGRED